MQDQGPVGPAAASARTELPQASPDVRDSRRAPALDDIGRSLGQLQAEMRTRHKEHRADFEAVHPLHRQGAQNLVDYLTLRGHDMRPLQSALAEHGLSSLGRSEEHVLATLERVLAVVLALSGGGPGPRTEAAVDFAAGERSLEANSDALLGVRHRGRSTRILVTMPTEAADDRALVAALFERGMDCARINCAHDGPDVWRRMVANLRDAATDTDRSCKIFMDLPGPKLRTGPVEEGPRVVRLRPTRDQRGIAAAPARAALVGSGDPGDRAATVDGSELPVDPAWLGGLSAGERVTFRDTRGSSRILTVTDAQRDRATVECADTAYLEHGTSLRRADGATSRVGPLPALEQTLRLHPGDVLELRPGGGPADPAGVETGGTRRFSIACTLPSALRAARVGDRVLLDDGKIAGHVVEAKGGTIDVLIDAAGPRGTKLHAGRGINLPDSDLGFGAIGPEDVAILPVVVELADGVELSFVQREDDVVELRRRLDGLGGGHLAVILKIETVSAFNHLPELLLAAMASECVGVMVARGDLAVECGFERLAEVQEEILWLCASAHVPVIWATQVLDQMAQTGLPSRAEVSDAALAARAECVMLNKGPHIIEAVAALDDILRRMSGHQRKKVPLLRQLRSWSAPGW